MPGKLAPTPCPKCGGAMWDNQFTKRNPKAPDYACKNKEGCGAGVWLKDSEKNAQQGREQLASGQPSGPQPAQKPRGIILDKAMEQCIVASKEMLAQQFKTGSEIPPELVVNLATTMFIVRTDGRGILKVEKQSLVEQREKAAKAEAERRRLEEEEARRRAQDAAAEDPSNPMWSPDDDDLPF